MAEHKRFKMVPEYKASIDHHVQRFLRVFDKRGFHRVTFDSFLVTEFLYKFQQERPHPAIKFYARILAPAPQFLVVAVDTRRFERPSYFRTHSYTTMWDKIGEREYRIDMTEQDWRNISSMFFDRWVSGVRFTRES